MGEGLGRASSECSLTILPSHEGSQVLSLESCHQAEARRATDHMPLGEPERFGKWPV